MFDDAHREKDAGGRYKKAHKERQVQLCTREKGTYLELHKEGGLFESFDAALDKVVFHTNQSAVCKEQ